MEDMPDNPRIPDTYTTILWVLYPDGKYHGRFGDVMNNRLRGFAMSQRINKDTVMDRLSQIIKSFIDAILNENLEEIDKDLRDLLEVLRRHGSHPRFRRFGFEITPDDGSLLMEAYELRKLGLFEGDEPLGDKLKFGWNGFCLAFMMCLLGLSNYHIAMGGKDMSAAQIGPVTTDVIRGVFEILKAFLLRPEVKSRLPSHTLGHSEPTELAFDVLNANLEDVAKVGNENAARETTWFGRMRRRLLLSSKVVRWLDMAICIAIETAAAIVGFIGMFSACALIPIIGQALMMVGLVISIVYLVFGGPEPEKISGEKFVDSMRGDGGWLKKIDDAPSTALGYTITPTEIPKEADFSFKITVKNTKNSSIELISTPNAEKSATDTEILSIRFGFTTGSDTMCLFSNESFSTAPDAQDGKCSYSGPDHIFQTKQHEPNGKVRGVTSYEYELQPLP
ncbi:hypothetical protein FBULB1_11518 [Fusarium bulbicola]|nr:hypothetical protein FBULB1_11518 [Fusarium bulbicola]